MRQAFYILPMCIYLSTISLQAAAPAGPAAPDWRLAALRKQKEPNHYYTLLNITENEIFAAAGETPPRDRAAVITAKLQERAANIDAPTPLLPEEKDYVIQELQKAAQFINNPENVRVYSLLGHTTYSFIEQQNNQLFQALAGKNIDDILKIAAQFLLSLSLGKDMAEATTDATKSELINQPAPTTVPASDRIIADALGGVLYESLDKTFKRALAEFISANPPADPADVTVPYLNNILKEYIKILQCKLTESTCPTKKDAKKERKDKAPSDEKKDAAQDDASKTKAKPAEAGQEQSDIAIASAVKRANEKLVSALHELEQAKGYMRSVTGGPERAFIKNKVKQALDDYSTIRNIANALKGKDNSQYNKLVQLVDQIYKIAGSF